MLFQFNQKDIDNWVKFSGDYNPIHFDAEAARRYGLDEIIVHGMLPLMHIKNILSLDLPVGGNDEWPVISCKFRQPVGKERPHRLEVNDRPTGRRFSLRCNADGKEVFAGQAGTSLIDPFVATESQRIYIGNDVIEAKRALFESTYSEFDRAWIFLDAVVFSQFLCNEIPFEMFKNTGSHPEAVNQVDLMRSVLTMQISHKTLIAPFLCNVRLKDVAFDQGIECDIVPPIMTSNSSESLAGVYQMNVSASGRFLMQSEVGMFIRLGPPNFSTTESKR